MNGMDNDVITALNENGVRTLRLGYLCGKNIESAHADMRVLHLGGNEVLTLAGDEELNRRLRSLGFNVTQTQRHLTEFKYPECTALNCLLCGSTAFANFRNADAAVSAKLSGYVCVNVRQGYTKCSAAVVRSDAIITADETIYRAATDCGIDVLKISEGGIHLCERYHGFIGGACFLIESNTLAFFGELRKHRDYDDIKAFCGNHGVYTLDLCGGALRDIGGVVSLLQEVV